MIDSDDYEESPQYEEYQQQHTFNHEHASGPVDYYNTVKKPQVSNKKPWDSGEWYDEDPNELKKSLAQPINQISLAIFNHKKHVNKELSSRNTLLNGTLHTASEIIDLRGFVTWQEFQDHIADGQQPQAKRIKEHLQTEAALNFNLGEVSFTYWVAKNSTGVTRPGYWAIVITTPSERAIVHSTVNGLVFSENLSLIDSNRVRVSSN